MASCNIYSYLYTNTMKYYYKITNNFPGGLFRNVKKVSLLDECPFPHEFFIQISKSFPVITNSSLNNKTSQKKKNCEQKFFSVVEFSHLTELYFDEAHDDYIEQFLFGTKTFLSNKILLGIEYQQLKRVTHDFTRLETRNNCSKVGYPYQE
ncbi:unnamed protein product [Rotaria sp. Silwood2]|nr:unnamed protein product [Rotaria sp. Silwood2]